jgi:hypothetical protein
MPHLWKAKCEDYSDTKRKRELYKVTVTKQKEVEPCADSGRCAGAERRRLNDPPTILNS